jgi:hypothetical protein
LNVEFQIIPAHLYDRIIQRTIEASLKKFSPFFKHSPPAAEANNARLDQQKLEIHRLHLLLFLPESIHRVRMFSVQGPKSTAKRIGIPQRNRKATKARKQFGERKQGLD